MISSPEIFCWPSAPIGFCQGPLTKGCTRTPVRSRSELSSGKSMAAVDSKRLLAKAPVILGRSASRGVQACRYSSWRSKLEPEISEVMNQRENSGVGSRGRFVPAPVAGFGRDAYSERLGDYLARQEEVVAATAASLIGEVIGDSTLSSGAKEYFRQFSARAGFDAWYIGKLRDLVEERLRIHAEETSTKLRLSQTDSRLIYDARGLYDRPLIRQSTPLFLQSRWRGRKEGSHA